MATYYVPKKNRCPCNDSGATCEAPFTLRFGVSSGLFMSQFASKSVYNTYSQTSVESPSIVGKGKGNIAKLGSGGNSYEAYLARKKGVQYCNCNAR